MNLSRRIWTMVCGAGSFLLTALLAPAAAPEPCRIEVVDAANGWPVPLVELRTTHAMRFVTDNAGLIAFNAPELMGRETWFDVFGHGYEAPKDAFGYRGFRVTPQPGTTVRLEVKRSIIAKRLGRLTGGGLFAESQLLGGDTGWRDSGIVGCDSVQNAVHQGRMFWFWGDTTMSRYPLGIFDATGATTAVQPLTKFEPPLRLKLDYFTDPKGMPRGVARMPGSGPTWLSGCFSLPDKKGEKHLVTSYMKIHPPLDGYEAGLAVWNESSNAFAPYRVLWTKSEKTPKPPLLLDAHVNLWKDAAGKAWLLFGNPFPNARCPATFEGWADTNQWEALTPPETIAAVGEEKPIRVSSGSIAWNAWRKRWVTVFLQAGGKSSFLGEVWYAEADRPTGPWGPAIKVLSHENYSFYNPKLHAEFTPKNSPVLVFEGTYVTTFTDNKQPTPRYEYNQILYRLDLDDPALKAAQIR